MSALLSGELPPLEAAPPPSALGLERAVRQMEAEADGSLQLSSMQVELIKESVFGADSFYFTGVEQTTLGTVFRGNIKGESDAAYSKVTSAAANLPQLRGVRFLLLVDPSPRTLEQLEADPTEERQPVFLCLSGKAGTLGQSIPEYAAVVISFFVSCFTTLGFSLSTYLLARGPSMLEQIEGGDVGPLEAAIPIAAGIAALQLVHELAHAYQARKYDLKVGLPVLVPSLQLGVYGCITRLLDFPKSRQALFDFSIAGPAAAGILSVSLFAAGLGLSLTLPDAATAAGAYPVVPSALLQSSFLLGSFAQAVLPSIATEASVQLHPLAVIGFASAFLNALQLLPIGRLDGGRVTHAVLGQQTAGVVSGVSLFALGVSTFFTDDNPILLFFGLLIILLQRQPELPAQDDISGVTEPSKIAAAAAILFALLTVLPMPGAGAPPVDMSGMF